MVAFIYKTLSSTSPTNVLQHEDCEVKRNVDVVTVRLGYTWSELDGREKYRDLRCQMPS